VVPVQAVIGGAESGEERTIYVLSDKGPQERKIKIGLSNEKMVEVITGLEEGDQVITNPKVILGDKIKTREPGTDRKGDGKNRGKGGPKGGGKESNGEGQKS
jgi:HlyD family secretion protein